MIAGGAVLEGQAGQAYEKAATTLLCDCGCNPQSIKECACGHAEDLRVSIAKDARSGKSGDEIIAAYVARYGQKILVSPPASGFNLIAWTGPAIGLVGAALAIALVIRRWHRRSGEASHDPASDPSAPSAVDEVYLARLRREVDEGR